MEFLSNDAKNILLFSSLLLINDLHGLEFVSSPPYRLTHFGQISHSLPLQFDDWVATAFDTQY